MLPSQLLWEASTATSAAPGALRARYSDLGAPVARCWSPRRALLVLGGHIHAMSPILSAERAAGVRGGAAVWGGRGVHKWPESGHLLRVF